MNRIPPSGHLFPHSVFSKSACIFCTNAFGVKVHWDQKLLDMTRINTLVSFGSLLPIAYHRVRIPMKNMLKDGEDRPMGKRATEG